VSMDLYSDDGVDHSSTGAVRGSDGLTATVGDSVLRGDSSTPRATSSHDFATSCSSVTLWRLDSATLVVRSKSSHPGHALYRVCARPLAVVKRCTHRIVCLVYSGRLSGYMLTTTLFLFLNVQCAQCLDTYVGEKQWLPRAAPPASPPFLERSSSNDTAHPTSQVYHSMYCVLYSVHDQCKLYELGTKL
jgi:hypothetical protein